MFALISFNLHRFRVFHSAICLHHVTSEAVVMACCCLHNLMRIRAASPTEGDQEHPTTHQLVPGDWRRDDNLPAITVHPPTRSTQIAKNQRTYLKDYFSSEAGSVPWQNRMI